MEELAESLADRAARRPSVHGLGLERGADTDSDAEEWDRHESAHPAHDNTAVWTHTDERPERLFEEEVTWEDACDKGDNSGLVMYTDGLFWNARRGDFDERTADDWGIDHSLATEKGIYGEGGVPDAMWKSTQNYVRAGERKRRRAGAMDPATGSAPRPLHDIGSDSDDGGLDGRSDGGDSDSSADPYEGGAGGDASADARNGYFTAPKYTDGPGEARVSVGGVPGKGGPRGRRSTRRMGKGEAMALRVLRRHGWVAGMGMGRHNQGRREPVLAEPHKDKRGVGWGGDHGAMQRLARRDLAERQRLVAMADPEKVVISTAWDFEAQAARRAARAAAMQRGGVFPSGRCGRWQAPARAGARSQPQR